MVNLVPNTIITITSSNSNSNNRKSNMMEKHPPNLPNVYLMQVYSVDVPNQQLTHVMDIMIVHRRKCVWQTIIIDQLVRVSLVMSVMKYMGVSMNILQDWHCVIHPIRIQSL